MDPVPDPSEGGSCRRCAQSGIAAARRRGNDFTERLRRAGESTDDPMIQRVYRQANVPPVGYRCFSLFSAWTDEPLQRIVARRFVVAEPQ